MRNFKKILLAVVLWLLTIVLLSAVVVGPYMYLESHFYGDKEAEDSVDTVIVGSSQGQQSFMPSVLNRELGVNAYNLSCTAMTIHGRRDILEDLSDDHELKTVIVEISADVIVRDIDPFEGDMTLLPKFKSPWKQLRFMAKNIAFDDIDDVYAYDLIQGLYVYKNFLTHQLDSTQKGFRANSVSDQTIPEAQRSGLYNADRFDVSGIPQERLDSLYELVDFCADRFDSVCFVIVPVSDAMIWRYDGWDEVLAPLKARCEAVGVRYVDYNLIRSRGELFHDDVSFYNEDHMSAKGAEAFSLSFCDCLKRMEAGEDVSALFYNDYNELKQSLPYAADLP